MIEVRKIESKKDIKKFVQFQMDLYKDNKFFVPPIIKDELAIFDPNKNQVFKNADCWMFLAYQDNRIVGRVAALFMEGPVGFSNMDKAGLLIKGFDELSTMITWYNHPYYKEHLEQLGYVKAAEWVEFKFQPPNPIPDKINRFADIIAKRYTLKSLQFSTTKEILPYVDAMFDLLNKTYSNLVTYVPIQQYQIELYKEKYLPFINPDFIELVVDQEDKLVGFAITMPSFSKALQKANGKLFPFGFIHLLKAKKKNKEAAFYLIGIDPEYQGKGVTAMMFRNIIVNFMNYGIKKCETNPELEDNLAVQASWKNYEPTLHKRRRTYRKDI